jgi:hypothetical protein
MVKPPGHNVASEEFSMRDLIPFAALAAGCATWGLSAQAATIAVPAPATPYTQNFNSLTTITATPAPVWVNESTLAGWSLFNAAGAPITACIGDLSLSAAVAAVPEPQS